MSVFCDLTELERAGGRNNHLRDNDEAANDEKAVDCVDSMNSACHLNSHHQAPPAAPPNTGSGSGGRFVEPLPQYRRWRSPLSPAPREEAKEKAYDATVDTVCGKSGPSDELIRDLRRSVAHLGIDFLTALYSSAPKLGIEYDARSLHDHLEALKKLAQGQALSFVHGAGNDVACTMLDKRLPVVIEHKVYEYLGIVHVRAAQHVSRAWHSGIRDALAHAGDAPGGVAWDLVHCEGVDPEAHVWLEHVGRAGVKVRSLHLGAHRFPDVARKAAERGYANAVRVLGNHFALAAIGDDSEGTPLNIAASYGHLNVVRVLMAVPDIDFSAADSMGRTPLHCAAVGGHPDTVRVLLEQPNVDVNAVNNDGKTSLYFAAAYGHAKVAEVLVGVPGIDVNAGQLRTDTPLGAAVASGHLSIVKVLIAVPGVDVNAGSLFRRTPLYEAVALEHLSIIKVLLEVPGIDVNFVDGFGKPLLHFAVEKGRLEIVKALVARPDIDVNGANKFGQTPLHLVAESGRADIAKVLVKGPRVDVNAGDMYGITALRVAVLHDRLDVARVLVAMPDIDVNAVPIHGGAPLHLAIGNRIEFAKLLVEAPRVDVNVGDEDGRTPLHLAAYHGRLDVAKLLVRVEATEVNAVDNHGDTPLALAVTMGHRRVEAMLRNVVGDKKCVIL